MALHSTPTILERALQALQEYERTHGQAGPSAVLPFDQPTTTSPVDALPVCPVHPASATWWHLQDGSPVCGLCHPDSGALVGEESAQSGPPAMPDGVRLLRWDLKQPPVEISRVSVVMDPQKFALSTLRQLNAALRGRYWGAGNRNVRDLIERLEQVGIRVTVAQKG